MAQEHAELCQRCASLSGLSLDQINQWLQKYGPAFVQAFTAFLQALQGVQAGGSNHVAACKAKCEEAISCCDDCDDCEDEERKKALLAVIEHLSCALACACRQYESCCQNQK